MALLGVTCLVGALPFTVGPPPARIAAGRLPDAGIAAVSITAPVPTESPAPQVEQGANLFLAREAEEPPTPTTPDCLVVRCVALTFDDGPVADTQRLLGMLASAGVKATFFDIGEMAADNPEAVRAELEQGNEVGNHSWSHPQMTHLTDDRVRDQVHRTAQELASIDGLRPTLFRPPYGDMNDRVRAVLAEQGDPVILWSVDTLDWLHRDPDSVYRRAVSGVRPGSIVLMHDIHPTTVAAVPRVIAELTRRGYTFVTVSELFGGKLEPGVIYTGREQEWEQQHRAAPPAPERSEADQQSAEPSPQPTP
jgi:peptidoglycan/xylan/chitin deacetylase (PgdA/CDA1 family)